MGSPPLGSRGWSRCSLALLGPTRSSLTSRSGCAPPPPAPSLRQPHLLDTPPPALSPLPSPWLSAAAPAQLLPLLPTLRLQRAHRPPGPPPRCPAPSPGKHLLILFQKIENFSWACSTSSSRKTTCAASSRPSGTLRSAPSCVGPTATARVRGARGSGVGVAWRGRGFAGAPAVGLTSSGVQNCPSWPRPASQGRMPGRKQASRPGLWRGREPRPDWDRET